VDDGYQMRTVDWQAGRIRYAHSVLWEVRIMMAWGAGLAAGFLCASGFLLKMGRCSCPVCHCSTAGAG